jgi:hypothetical protein
VGKSSQVESGPKHRARLLVRQAPADAVVAQAEPQDYMEHDVVRAPIKSDSWQRN